MTPTHSRRTVAMALASLGVGIGVDPFRGLRSSGAQSNGIESGGIGLSRGEWESIYGPGDATQTHVIYREPTYGGPIYVGFDFANFGDGLLDFLELQWSDASQAGGLAQEDASNLVSSLLPADVRLRETYLMGATPGGPIALRSQRWTSDSLDSLTNGRASMLVIYQETTGPSPDRSGSDIVVTAATIAVEQA